MIKGGGHPVQPRGKSISGHENFKCKSPAAGMDLGCLKRRNEEDFRDIMKGEEVRVGGRDP